MEWNRQNLKGLLLVVCVGAAAFCAFQHLHAVAAAVLWTIEILSPFLLGSTLAFVLNVPMRAIERHIFPKERSFDRVRRPVALVITLMALIGVLFLAGRVIAPGIKDAVKNITDQLPDAFDRFAAWILSLETYLPALEQVLKEVSVDWANLSQKAVALVQNWGVSLLSAGGGLIGGIVSGAATFLIGLIFAFYILLQKERLARQGRQVFYALLPERRADRALDVIRLADRTFSGFLSGQCLEAVILGTMFVVVMTLFRMPYALLVGVLIALTALIPIVGAFIGCAVGALLIAVTDPLQALVFVILFLVVQQIEGNLIYPHVVGNSVGLPSIWVLAAVTLGGKLMGVAGMLFFIPFCSVLYALFREYVKARLQEKAVPAEKWQDEDRRIL